MGIIPIFTIHIEGLSLTLEDITSPISGVSWSRAWFLYKEGVSIPQASTEPILEVILEPSSSYKVKLVLTSDSIEYPSEVRLYATDTEILLTQSIQEVVSSIVDPDLIDWDKVNSLKKVWQKILGENLGVATSDIYNEVVYPQLGNTLIGYLIVRDLISVAANSLVIQSAQGSGAIAEITTGPSTVKRHDPAVLYKNTFGHAGPYKTFLSQICSLAQSLGIMLKDCENTHVTTFHVMYFSDQSYKGQIAIVP